MEDLYFNIFSLFYGVQVLVGKYFYFGAYIHGTYIFIPQVSNTTHQVEGAISHRYQCIFAEQQSFRPVGWLGEFGKNNSCHTRLKQFR